MKRILPVLLILFTLSIQAQEPVDNAGFDEDGMIAAGWVFTTDHDSGNVIRSDFIDASGKRKFSNVAHYSKEGKHLETRRYGSSGKLIEVIVRIGDRLIGLTPDGQVEWNRTSIDSRLKGLPFRKPAEHLLSPDKQGTK